VPVWLLFKQGYFDVGGIPKEAFNQAIKISTGELTPDLIAKGMVLTKHTEPVTEYIGFNMTDPVLGKNKPLRQALSMAFDRKSYIHIFLNDRGQPAIGPIPPGFETFDDQQGNPYTQFNLELAKEKMKEAVKINGGPIPPMSILMRDADTVSRQMAEFFSSQAKQIGVTLVPQFRDFARWQEMVDNRQTQLFDAGWEADYPDELDFLQLFYSKNAPQGGINSTVYVNPVFDKLYDKAATLQDTPQRKALYQKMEQMVMEDCPWLCEMYPQAWGLKYNWVKSGLPMDYGNGMLQYTRLDRAQRDKESAAQ
jgi:oligopeptide transport system substrate-binding protein